MPRQFKVGDIVEGKHAALRNQRERITEVIAIAGGNNFKVRWLNGGEGTYTSRANQFHVPAQPGGVVIVIGMLSPRKFAEILARMPLNVA